MADALGLGYMVAHSERVKMVRNGKMIEGNFMELAEGFDINDKDQNKVNTLKEAVSDDAGLQRDANRMEMFDFLCGQSDRHTGNMIYTLGEPGDDGKRRITGIKAIDNDGSFLSNRKWEVFREETYNRHIKNIPSVDKELAERIMKLDREKLEFYLGDVLDKKSLDNTMERLNEMKEYFKTCSMIEKEDWEKNTPVVKDLQKNAKGGVFWYIKTTLPYGAAPKAFFQLSAEQAIREQEKQQMEQKRRERVIQEYHEKTGRAEIGKGNSGQRVKMNAKELQELEDKALNQIKNRRNSFYDKRARATVPQKTQETQKQRAMGR